MTTVLVIEDNALTRQMACIALTAEGYTVLEAETGAAGLASLLREGAVVSELGVLEAVDESQAVSSALLGFFGRYSRLVMHGGDPDEMLDELLAGTLDASGASCGAAWLSLPDGNLVLRGQIGYPDQARADLDDACGAADLLKQVLADGVPIALSSDGDCTEEVEALLACARARALVLVPLLFGAEPIGILVLGLQRPASRSYLLRMAEAIRGPIAQAVALSRTLAELVSSRQVFRGITESASDAILVADGGVVTYANPAARDLFGGSGTLVGRGIDRLLPFLAPAPCWWSRTTTRSGQ